MEVLKVVYKGESKYNIPLLPVAKNDMAQVISKFVVYISLITPIKKKNEFVSFFFLVGVIFF